ncbi:OX-2 membrane glycoprotein-like [Perognathus longimembris pacificus]|uniref:OX-2 membrane glycoprotein-like n=1 Tax=Perognathus longimembris pacificus TaxID=214514 RepID=UPI0020184191|nr:OX-2 membrane glycoprotein-like [Perognathus longimembris pacificus]
MTKVKGLLPRKAFPLAQNQLHPLEEIHIRKLASGALLFINTKLLILLICGQQSDLLHPIKHKNNETAVWGENVTIFCNWTTKADVVQITWQKIQDASLQNIGTYSSTFGEKILPPYVNRLQCKIIKPNSSFITIQKVTFDDEACYKCLLNVFPYGSLGGNTCLNILTVSELTTEVEFHPGSEEFLSFIYSAVGKPAPQISLFPSQVLMNSSKEYLSQNQNGTVTVTKMFTISLGMARFLGIQHLIVLTNHPLGNKERIISLPEKQECSSLWIVVIVLIIFTCVLFIIFIILCVVQRKKKSEITSEEASFPLNESLASEAPFHTNLRVLLLAV